MANLIKSNDPGMSVGLKTLVARLEHKVSEVGQQVGGGMVAIVPYEFRSQAEVGAFVKSAFLSGVEVYNCFLSVSMITQRVTQGVSDLATLQADGIHEHRVKRGRRKTKVIASFQSKCPTVFGKIIPISELKSVHHWTNFEKDGFADLLAWRRTFATSAGNLMGN